MQLQPLLHTVTGVGTLVTSNVFDPVALDTATHAALAARQPAATSRRMGFGPQVLQAVTACSSNCTRV